MWRYVRCLKTSIEWQKLHLCHMVYYLLHYDIRKIEFFNVYHYWMA
ncbi:sigma(X)-activator ComW [Streptococcus cristatus]